MRIAIVVIIVGLLAALPWTGNTVLLQFGISVLLLATLAQGWNIIGGYTGYPSFGNSVFYGLGAYGVAIAMVQLTCRSGAACFSGLVPGGRVRRIARRGGAAAQGSLFRDLHARAWRSS